MKTLKYIIVALVLLVPNFVYSDIIVEGLEVPGYWGLHPRGIDDSGDRVVLIGRQIADHTDHSIVYNILSEEIEDMGFAAPTDCFRVMDISTDGKQACGFNKHTGDIFTYQIGVGITEYDGVAGYEHSRAVAINKSKAVVGYAENPSYPNMKRVGIWKKGTPSGDLSIYTHPYAYRVTEFLSIDTVGWAVGRTDTGYIFEFNVQTGVMNNIVEGTPPPTSYRAGLVSDSGKSVELPPEISVDADGQTVDFVSYGNIVYNYKDPSTNEFKVIIWNKTTLTYEALTIPGVDSGKFFVGGSNSHGQMFGSDGNGAFIATIVHNVGIEDVSYDSIYQKKWNDKMHIGIDLESYPFELESVPNGTVVPIKITVDIKGMSGEFATVRYQWAGSAAVNDSYYYTFFDIP